MRKALDNFIPFCFLLPYVEISLIRNLFEYSSGQANLPASVFLLILVGVVFLIAAPKKGCGVSPTLCVTAVCYHYYLLVRLIVAGFFSKYSFTVLLFQWLWFVVPFWYAIIIVNYINKRNLDIRLIINRGVICFAAYVLLCIVINIVNYGFSFDIFGENRNRIISTGGGPVILGYTIALVLALIFIAKPFKTKFVETVIVGVLVIGALFTGSRGGIWPTLVLVLFFIITNKKRKLNFAVLSVLVFVIALLNPIELLGELFPRILSINESGRITSFINGIKCFSYLNPVEWLFGTGLGNFFPYQEYSNFHVLGVNTFHFNGVRLLVQPHNTYIYILIETGFIGLIFYALLLKNIFTLNGHRTKNKTIFYALFVLLGFIESTVFIQPGSAGLWWLICLVLSITNEIDLHNKR